MISWQTGMTDADADYEYYLRLQGGPVLSEVPQFYGNGRETGQERHTSNRLGPPVRQLGTPRPRGFSCLMTFRSQRTAKIPTYEAISSRV